MRWVSVNGDGQDVGPCIENALRAVAVMHIDIEDRDALVALPQMSRCDRGVVEKAEAAGHVGIGVMTGRAAERVAGILAVDHELRRGHRDIGRRTGAGPGAGADRTGGIGGVPAELADDAGRIGRGMANRVNVGNHLRPGIAQRRPFVPGFRQKAQIFRAVHPGARPLAERNGLDELMGAGGKPLEQTVRALGLFGGAPDHAAHQEELRVMAAMPFGVDRFQVKPSPNVVKAGLGSVGIHREFITAATRWIIEAKL